MFTLAGRRWSPSIPAMCGRPAAVLPPVVDPGTVAGGITPGRGELTGLRPGTPVAAGGADTQLGLLGAGGERDEYTVVAGTFRQNTVLLVALIYMRVTGREEWMTKAQMVFEQTGSSH